MRIIIGLFSFEFNRFYLCLRISSPLKEENRRRQKSYYLVRSIAEDEFSYILDVSCSEQPKPN